MTKRPASLTIGQVAARTGLAVSAIRFYEERGLVRPFRDAGGRRRFRPADIRRLSFVLIAQQLGFSLEAIGSELGKLPAGRTPTRADWTKISRTFSTVLQERIDTMRRLQDRLDGCIGCGCLSLRNCALYNPGDRAALHGTGPRFVLEDDHRGLSGTDTWQDA